MATYSFTVRKGKFQLSLVTTDKEFLTEQFGLWVRDADEYAKQRKVYEHKNIINTQIKAEEEITKQNIAAQINRTDSDLKTNIQKTELSKEKEKNRDKEQIKDDLDIFYAPPKAETVAEIENKSSAESTGVFDSILENSLNGNKTELSFKQSPSIKKDNAFINFMGDQKIEKKIDYLLLTAYYFSQFEQKPRFTLKQLNSKLMQNLAVIVDHSILQEAINRDYIECLPDLTGLVGSSEYRLTAYGEKIILDA